jgi:hypothetical protein
MFVLFVDPQGSYADLGLTAVVLGGTAAVLALGARTLSRRSRTALLVTCTLTIALLVVHRTPAGGAMHGWFLD